jgi:hypothetical protein
MSELTPVNMGIVEKLSAENVERIFFDCLMPENLTDEQIEKIKFISTEGVSIGGDFQVKELNKHRQRITEMISQLPETFLQHEGGGWSFLNLCLNKDGQQWTDSHEVCDMLVCLGLAIDKIEFNIKDRSKWWSMPGGMPYVFIK